MHPTGRGPTRPAKDHARKILVGVLVIVAVGVIGMYLRSGGSGQSAGWFSSEYRWTAHGTLGATSLDDLTRIDSCLTLRDSECIDNMRSEHKVYDVPLRTEIEGKEIGNGVFRGQVRKVIVGRVMAGEIYLPPCAFKPGPVDPSSYCW